MLDSLGGMPGRIVVFALLAISAATSNVDAQVATSNFLTPDGAASGPDDPFSWTRGERGSAFAAWEIFTSVTGPNTHFPDFVSPLPSDPTLPPGGIATVTEVGAEDIDGDGNNDNGAFITSTNNIYSLSAPTEFDVVFSGHGLGVGEFNDTRFVAQVGTLGSVPDETTFTLEYTDALGATQQLLPNTITQLRNDMVGSPFGPATLRETLLVWDIEGFNPDKFLFNFAALEDSLSLDYLTVDTHVFLGLVGDYNNNGFIDGGDLDLFANQFGASGPNADGNVDEIVSAADYTIWRDSLIPSSGVAIASDVVVPEPTSVALMAVVVVFLSVRQRRIAFDFSSVEAING